MFLSTVTADDVKTRIAALDNRDTYFSYSQNIAKELAHVSDPSRFSASVFNEEIAKATWDISTWFETDVKMGVMYTGDHPVIPGADLFAVIGGEDLVDITVSPYLGKWNMELSWYDKHISVAVTKISFEDIGACLVYALLYPEVSKVG